MRSLAAARTCFALVLGLAVGCAPAAPPVAWIVEFESTDDRQATAILHAALHPGEGCTGDETWSTDVVRGEQPTAAPGPIGRGAWGLSAVALDARCGVIAAGCVEIEVPTRSSITIVARPDVRVCEGDECRGCRSRIDAGTTDAELTDAATGDADGGPADASPTDVGSVDAGPRDTGQPDTGSPDACGGRERCRDGIDNDCNGLADCEDPICAGIPGCPCEGCPPP